MTPAFDPKLSLSVDENTGHVRAAYIQERLGEVSETREVVEGRAFADYDASGTLLGVELLAPCELTELDKLAETEPDPIKQFLRGGPPRALVPA